MGIRQGIFLFEDWLRVHRRLLGNITLKIFRLRFRRTWELPWNERERNFRVKGCSLRPEWLRPEWSKTSGKSYITWGEYLLHGEWKTVRLSWGVGWGNTCVTHQCHRLKESRKRSCKWSTVLEQTSVDADIGKRHERIRGKKQHWLAKWEWRVRVAVLMKLTAEYLVVGWGRSTAQVPYRLVYSLGFWFFFLTNNIA